jgi:uncharacterized protein (TIGR03437 family)
MLNELFIAALLITETLSAAGAASTTIKLDSSANPVLIGQQFTLTATVSPSAATGRVTFFSGTTATPSHVIGVATLKGGVASFAVSSFAAAFESYSALYTGDLQYRGSRSSVLSVRVQSLKEGAFLGPKTFGPVSFPRSIVIADFNEDGKPDLAAPSYDANQLNILLGNGDGSFRTAVSYPTVLAPFEVVTSDFNGDGHADLAVANAATAATSISVFLGNGDGTMRPAINILVPLNPSHLATADFNGDGIADIVSSNFSDNTISVLLGNGDGTFKVLPSTPVPLSPGYIRAADLTGDGIPDIVLLANGVIQIMAGKGDGTFLQPQTFQAGPFPNYLLVTDLNADGRPDLVVSNAGDDTITVLYGAAPGPVFLAPVTLSGPKGIQVVAEGDFNGDNVPDLIAAGSTSNTFIVFPGLPGNVFGPTVTFPAGNGPIFVAVGDFNGDARADLAEADFRAQTLSILLGLPVPQPFIAAVVNGASFAAAGVAPGLIFTIAGRELGPVDGVTAQLDSQGRIATTLSGVTVTVDGAKAPLLFVRQDQINAVAPYALSAKAGQTVGVNVQYTNTSSPFAASVASVAPAIFSLGNGQGAIRNQDQSINGPTNPAAKGSFVSIYATGEGQLTPPGVDGQLVTDANTHPVENITATIGGVPATVQFQGSTLFNGFLQINLQVPDNSPSGTVPVVFKIAGVSSQSTITMAVK